MDNKPFKEDSFSKMIADLKLDPDFQLENESFYEELHDSDDDGQKPPSSGDYKERIDKIIAERAAKNFNNMTISFLRGHMKEEKEIEILDVLSESLKDPEIFTLYSEINKSEVGAFFAKLKTTDFDLSSLEKFRCDLLPLVAGREFEKPSGEEFARQTKIFFENFVYDHLKKKLEIEDARKELARLYKKLNKLAAEVLDPNFQKTVKLALLDKTTSIQALEAKLAVLESKKFPVIPEKDYETLVKENIQLEEKLARLKERKAKFDQLDPKKVEELRQLAKEVEFINQISGGPNKEAGCGTPDLSDGSLNSTGDMSLSFH